MQQIEVKDLSEWLARLITARNAKHVLVSDDDVGWRRLGFRDVDARVHVFLPLTKAIDRTLHFSDSRGYDAGRAERTAKYTQAEICGALGVSYKGLPLRSPGDREKLVQLVPVGEVPIRWGDEATSTQKGV